MSHAWELREAIRAQQPDLLLGGWANPHAETSRQVDFLLDERVNAEFYLTQVVSHHERANVARFLGEADRRGLKLPGVFGVFYYRSANPKTLATLGTFMPVPAAALAEEFAAGATPIDICARTIRALIDEGARAIYISNLPLATAQQTLTAILDRVGVAVGQVGASPGHSPALRHVAAAIHLDGLAGNEVGFQQRQDGLDDGLGAAPAAQGRGADDGVVFLFADASRPAGSGRARSCSPGCRRRPAPAPALRRAR